MSNLRLRVICTIMVIGIAIGMVATDANAALTFELSTPKTHYLIGEPLYVIVNFRNTGAEEAKLVCGFDPWDPNVIFHVTPPDGERYQYQPTSAATGGSEGGGIYLSPGDTFSAAMELTWEMRGRDLVCLLARPGEYVIEASYYLVPGDDSTMVRSNQHRLVVDEPQGIDREVYDLLKGVPGINEGDLWLPARGSDAAVIECYNKILQRFPTSGYTPHVAFFLACLHEVRTIIKTAEKDVDELGRAAQLFSLAAERTADTPLGPVALRYAGRCFATCGHFTEALGMFKAALTSHGATHHEKLNVLTFIRQMQKGTWQEKLSPEQRAPADLKLPLRSVAEAFGFRVTWDNSTRTVGIDGSRLHGTLQTDKALVTLNGAAHPAVSVAFENGEVMVSPVLIDAILIKQFGKRTTSTSESLPTRTENGGEEKIQ